MLFNSVPFLLFFAIVFCLYFLIPARRRWLLLLIASYLYYASWKPEYVLLIAAVTGVTYFTGLQMGKIGEKSKRRKYLALSLIINLGFLFIFKYFNFFTHSLWSGLRTLNLDFNPPSLDLVIPVGISFFTLQVVSYSLDVYRGTRDPESHLGFFALFVSFFPQILAGPIARAKHLLPQLRKEQAFDSQRITEGLQLMLWGLIQKTVIADRLAILVDQIYDDPTNFQGLPLIIATYFFAFQIFCDFAGYSNIAIGAAKVLGFDLAVNFRRPYFSKDVAEFWSRWHISLSNWLRDYVFFPVTRITRRWQSNWGAFANLVIPPLVTMLISGLWHGANWNFVIWGAIHGLFIILSVQTNAVRKKLSAGRFGFLFNMIQITITFNLVAFAWIFFRASSLSEAIYILRNLLVINEITVGIEVEYFIVGLVLISGLISVNLLQVKESVSARLARFPTPLRWAIYYGAIFMILYLGVFEGQEFLYAKF